MLWTAGYAAACGAATLLHMHFWQAAVILLPALGVAGGLCWTRPYPDYSRMDETAREAAEDAVPGTRRVIWLNGLWDFRLARERRWRRVRIPSVWNVIPGLKQLEGKAVYRRLFTAPADWSLGRVFLNFRGVNYAADVSLNGRLVGRTEGGYLPFQFDVGERLRDERPKELEVTISNTLPADGTPNVAGWVNDGGIPGEVYLETTPQLYIESLFVTGHPDLKGRAEIDVQVRVENPELNPVNYRVEAFSPQGVRVYEHVVEGWTMQTLQHRFQVQFVSLWDTENPGLYRCRVSILDDGGDIAETVFGIRRAEFRGRDFHLNGRKMRLRGVTWTGTHPDTGSALTPERIREDLELAKAAGFNLVRFGPLPAPEKALELCDRMGLLVMEEAPVWKPVGDDMRQPGYQRNAQDRIRRLVQRDRNHACVIAWGLASEMDSSGEEAHWFVERLVGEARGSDGQFLYLSTHSPEEDVCADLVDFVAVTYGSQRHGGEKELAESLGRWAALRPEKPLIVFFTPIGGQKTDGARTPLWPEETQAAHVMEVLKMMEGDEDVTGWVLSSLCDYPDPSQFMGPTPFVRLHGLLTERREKKLAYAAVQSRLKEGKDLGIPEVRGQARASFVPFAMAGLLGVLGLVMLALHPRWALWLAMDPKSLVLDYGPAWRVLLFFGLFNALGWSVMLNHFFRVSPQNLTGSISMPFFTLISRVLRSQVLLFFCAYGVILSLWVLDTTLVGLVMPEKGFMEVLALTGALSMPDLVFMAPAFTRAPLWAVLAVFNVWKLYLAVVTLGVWGMLVYVLFVPVLLMAVSVYVMERRFRFLKYVKSMM